MPAAWSRRGTDDTIAVLFKSPKKVISNPSRSGTSAFRTSFFVIRFRKEKRTPMGCVFLCGAYFF